MIQNAGAGVEFKETNGTKRRVNKAMNVMNFAVFTILMETHFLVSIESFVTRVTKVRSINGVSISRELIRQVKVR